MLPERPGRRRRRPRARRRRAQHDRLVDVLVLGGDVARDGELDERLGRVHHLAAHVGAADGERELERVHRDGDRDAAVCRGRDGCGGER